MNKVPPHSKQAESAVLGAILQGKATDVFDALAAEDFYLPQSRVIFESALSLFNEGKPIDEVTLFCRLERDGLLNQAGGIKQVTDLSRQLPAVVNLKHYLGTVVERSQRRQALKAAEQIIADVFDVNEIDDVIARAESSIYAIGQRKSSDMTHSAEAVAEAYLYLNELENGGHIMGIRTGYPDLDGVLMGMRGGQLIIPAARPSVGKTALAMNIAYNAAKSGETVAVFSLEMPNRDLAARMLCAEGRVSTRVAFSGRKQGSKWERIESATNEHQNMQLYLNDESNVTVPEIRAKLMQFKARTKKLDLVVIDYLQLIAHRGRKGTKNDEVSETTRALKIMAKDLDVPVMVLSQLSRDSEKEKRKPKLSDLRDSGSIEQDADIVLLIHREKENDNEPAEVIIAKNRNGPVRSIDLYWHGDYCRFDSASRFD